MKKTTKLLMLLALLTLGALASANAQIIVRVRPARPAVVVERPVAPSPRHVWVEEEWVPHGDHYVWHGGYWALPPRRHAVYVPGHWDRRGEGEIWIKGYWR